jgi:hypothetical protein
MPGTDEGQRLKGELSNRGLAFERKQADAQDADGGAGGLALVRDKQPPAAEQQSGHCQSMFER